MNRVMLEKVWSVMVYSENWGYCFFGQGCHAMHLAALELSHIVRNSGIRAVEIQARW